MTARFADHVLLPGTMAARPAANAVPNNALYPCTDDGTVYQSDGTTWTVWIQGGNTLEAIRDLIGATLVAGSGVTLTVDDAGDTVTIASAGLDSEAVRDAVGAALVAGSGITITVDDALDTITIAATGGLDAESVRDLIGATLVAGSGVTLTVDDAGDTVTIAASGGGGTGLFRGEWTNADTLLYSQVFASTGVPPAPFTLASASGGANPTVVAANGVSGLTDGGAGTTNALKFYVTRNTASQSSASLDMTALALSGVTKIKFMEGIGFGGYNDHHFEFRVNGVAQVTQEARHDWLERTVTIDNNDTLQWFFRGTQATSETANAELRIANIRIYGAPPTYMKNEVVVYQGGLWRSDSDNNTGTPGTSGWTQIPLETKKRVNAQTGTAYTLVLADAGKFVTMTNAGASTITVPPNSSVAFPVGTVIDGAQLGAGQVTLTQGAGVTINATPGLKVAAQYGTFGLLKVATDTWLAMGRLSA